MDSPDTPSAQPQRRLNLFDCVCIIVGIIIGAGIFETTPRVAGAVTSVPWLIAVWLLGGLISLLGALCYAEMATAYPRAGGDYEFLTRAFGRWMGLLFAWASFWIVRPGNIGLMAFIFGRYAAELWPLGTAGFDPILYAVAAVALLTVVNIVGVQPGKWTQNLLAAAKMLGLLLVVAAGFLAQSPAAPVPAAAAPIKDGDLGYAMIAVLFTFGGWAEMAYVAAEVRRPQVNILRALLLGTAAVTAIYLLVNLAALAALGLQGLRNAPNFAADLTGTKAIALLICASCLGAVAAMIFTGSRMVYAVGADHRVFRWLGQWHPRFATPARAIIVQSLVTIALMLAFGLYKDGFDRLLVFTAPLFWLFLLLAGAALVVLRRRDPHTPRPYRVLLYPLTPALFCFACGYMTYRSITYAAEMQYAEGWAAAGVMALGIAWVCYEARTRPSP